MNLFKKKYNILVLGSNGMLGKTLMEKIGRQSIDRNGCVNIIHGLDYPEIDLGVKGSIAEYLSKSVHYDFVINCAAVTNTSKIESGELRDQSFLINALAVKWIAEACRTVKTKLIHISTDYVFSEKNVLGYSNKQYNLLTLTNIWHPESSDEFPVNIYGMHKLVGELFIKNVFRSEKDYLIMRVSWLYGKYGNKSFVHRFLKNCMTKLNEASKSSNGDVEKIEVECTSNEWSLPTSCDGLFYKILYAMNHDVHGIVHACDNNSLNMQNTGISRFEFAKSIKSMMSKYVPALNRVNVVEHWKTLINESKMRYPEVSTMKNNNCEYFNSSLFEWEKSLRDFIDDNFNEIGKFICEHTEFTYASPDSLSTESNES